MQDAFTTALERWPRDGAAARTRARWIITTARNRAIDRLRRERDAAPRKAELLRARSRRCRPRRTT